MPMYLYECRGCEKQADIFHTIKEMEEKRNCACGGELFRVICPSNVQMDYEGYDCPVTGKWIEGKKAHRENLAKHGCRVFEAGESEAMLKRRADEDKDFERRLDDDVGRLVHNLPREKLKKLETEMEHGADIAVVRQ